jgi:integrase
MQTDFFDLLGAAAPAAAPPRAPPAPSSPPTLVNRSLEDDAEPVCVEGGGQANDDEAELPSNLAEAFAYFEDAVSDHPLRANFRSAFNTMGKALRLGLDQIPTAPKPLGALLRAANPALAGIKPRNWTQTKSLTRRALRVLGVSIMAGRQTARLDETWNSLMEQLPSLRLRIGLSRLVHFLSEAGTAPGEVNAESFAAYRSRLIEGSLHDKPSAAYRQAMRLWNQAASAVAEWPAVEAPEEVDGFRFSLAWDSFPKPFTDDLTTFLSSSREADFFDEAYSEPVRGVTLENRRQSLRRVASALVLSGKLKIEELTCLAVLVEPSNVKAALTFLRQRAGEQITEGHYNTLWALRTVALYWVKDEAAAKALRILMANIAKRPGRVRGMTAKNRERLRQFDLPQNLEALVALPMRALRSVQKRPGVSHVHAVRVMHALQVGILLAAPIRSKNLFQLKIGENLIDLGRGARRSVRIHLPKETTKTYRDYEAPLPPRLLPLLDEWMSVYRPRICPSPSAYLFPNASGQPRSRGAAAIKLTRFIERETGLKVNPHLFRHIAAKVQLEYDSNGIEVVRQLLGHTSTKTTLAVYAELQTDPAFHRQDEALTQGALRRARKATSAERTTLRAYSALRRRT